MAQICIPDSLSAKKEKSFAYYTMKDRIPLILSKVVDHLHRNKEKLTELHNKGDANKSKEFIGYLSKLRNEIQTDKPVVMLQDDEEDVNLWNDHLSNFIKTNNRSPSSFQDAWLYIECYVYRKIEEASNLSGLKYDVFFQQKCESFRSSNDPIEILNTNYITQATPGHQMKEFFIFLLKISLWGNKCDLSISGMEENAQTDNPLHQIDQLESFVLVDDSSVTFDHLLKCSKSVNDATVDIILDNAGFELFTDMILCLYLLETGLASIVNLHMKKIPWFVSDVTRHDFDWVMDQLSQSDTESATYQVFTRFKAALYDKKILLQDDSFWTTQFPYFEMPKIDPKLYSQLKNSSLVIFKGDLNYRKLVADLEWEYGTKFVDALQGFDVTLIALRTLKADVVTGLEPGKGEELGAKDPDWMTTGQYGLMQASLPK